MVAPQLWLDIIGLTLFLFESFLFMLGNFYPADFDCLNWLIIPIMQRSNLTFDGCYHAYRKSKMQRKVNLTQVI